MRASPELPASPASRAAAGPGGRPTSATRAGRTLGAAAAGWGALALALAASCAIGCGDGGHPGYLADPGPSADAAIPAADVALPSDDAARPDALALDAASAGDAASWADAAGGLNVLFIGNSYTFVNDLPGTLQALAVAEGNAPAIAVSSVAVGGYTLQNHWQGPDAQAAIAKGGLTHVVLQGQSAEPVGDPANFETYAKLFAAAATAAHAQPVFFETWARQAGCADYTTYPWLGGTPAAMQDSLSHEYVAVAAATSAKVAPVGEAFREVWTLYPSLVLYQGDGSHPSVAGTYLAACVFYDVLTGHAVAGTGGVPGGVSASDAAILRDAAAHTVATH